MSDPLDAMQMEARKLNANVDEAEMVNMMRDFMKLGFTGIEFANDRLKLLRLEGWADSVCNDLHKYDAALAKIYRKYWRKSSATPEMEILMGIGTSLFMHHCKHKYMSGAAAAGSSGADSTPGPAAGRPPPRSSGGPRQRQARGQFHMPSHAPNDSGSSDDDEAPPPSVVEVSIE